MTADKIADAVKTLEAERDALKAECAKLRKANAQAVGAARILKQLLDDFSSQRWGARRLSSVARNQINVAARMAEGSWSA